MEMVGLCTVMIESGFMHRHDGDSGFMHRHDGDCLSAASVLVQCVFESGVCLMWRVYSDIGKFSVCHMYCERCVCVQRLVYFQYAICIARGVCVCVYSEIGIGAIGARR